MALTSTCAGIICACYNGTKFAEYMSVSEDMKALGTIEVDISNLITRDSMSFVWRRKPVFIRNRT